MVDPHFGYPIGDLALDLEPFAPDAKKVVRTPIWLGDAAGVDRKLDVLGSSIWCLLIRHHPTFLKPDTDSLSTIKII